MAKNTKLWSDKKITQEFYPADRALAKLMRNEYEAELEKLRQQIAELTDTCNQLAEKLVQEPI